MYNRRYDKIFIMLKQDTFGYSDGHKQIAGNACIEIKNGKGKLITYAQGLRQSKDSVYRVFMIAAGKSGVIGVGTSLLEIDDKGQGNAKWEFDVEDVGGTGIAVEDFNTVAVMVEETGMDKSLLVTPLVGYKDEKMTWKDRFVCHNQKEKNKVIAPSQKEKANKVSNENLTPTKNTQKASHESPDTLLQQYLSPNKNESIEDSNDESKQIPPIQQKSNPHKEQTLMPVKPEYESTKPATWNDSQTKKVDEEFPCADTDRQSSDGILTTEKSNYATKSDFYGDFHIMANQNPHDTFKEIAIRFKKEMEELEQEGVLTKEEICSIQKAGTAKQMSDIDLIFSDNTKMIPFGEKDKINWVRICLDEMIALPIKDTSVMRLPLVVSAYRKYQHLIVGKMENEDKRQYFFGAPDCYEPDYKMNAAHSGFSQFQCCDNSNPNKGSYGYWLMVLD